MNAYDLAAIGYTGFAAWRGKKRGAGEEAYRLLRVGVALIAGSGLYSLFTGVLSSVSDRLPAFSGAVGFVAVFVGALYLMRKIRGLIVTRVNAVWGDKGAPIAAAFGAVRGFTVALSAGIAAALTRVDAIENLVLQDSWLGAVIRMFVHGG